MTFSDGWRGLRALMVLLGVLLAVPATALSLGGEPGGAFSSLGEARNTWQTKRRAIVWLILTLFADLAASRDTLPSSGAPRARQGRIGFILPYFAVCAEPRRGPRKRKPRFRT